MNCERVQSELSRRMDEGTAPSTELLRHASACEECSAFQEVAVEVGRRYRIQVRSGIDRMRRLEGPAWASFRRRPRAWLLIPLAAASLLLFWREAPVAPPAPAPIARASEAPRPAPASRIRLFDGEELSLVFRPDLPLPVRLAEDLLPLPSAESDIVLPLSLRF